MRNILIAIVAIFTFAGAQAAEPRANKGKVNKVIKAIKELDGKQIKVNEYDADSIAEDIKKQLYEQFDEEKVDNTCAPCGVCRQVMMEFCNPDRFKIVMANGKDNAIEILLKDLLPYGFGPNNL